MSRLLSESEVASRLKKLGSWAREGKFLTRTFEFDDFIDGIAFINRVAELAERKQHHPNISVVYTTVKLSVQTHSSGGITEKDFDLATAIDTEPGTQRR